MSLYTKVTDKILQLLETGCPPWVKPWSSTAGRNIPCNAISNRAYSGVNTLLLWTSQVQGFQFPRFLTFGQAKRLGGSVRQGEHGFKIYFVKKMQTKKENPEDEPRNFTILREYTVFNVEQCEGLPDNVVTPEPPKIINKERRHQLADYFLACTKANIREGAGEAYYNPNSDYISLPGWSQFHGRDSFYDVAFHELTHWTGHNKRLARDLKNRFGTRQYAAEELIAELGSSFLCAEFGFDTTNQNAAYIQNWIDLLREDNRAIFTAASHASKAADYLRNLALQEETLAVPLEQSDQWPSGYPQAPTTLPSTPPNIPVLTDF
jgi:antirestriction protein ArdC